MGKVVGADDGEEEDGGEKGVGQRRKVENTTKSEEKVPIEKGKAAKKKGKKIKLSFGDDE